MSDSIVIRPYQDSDAESICAAVRESIPDLGRWMSWCHSGYSLEDSRTWLYEQGKLRAADKAFEFGIHTPAGVYLGGCGLNQIAAEHRTANLGYWVRSSATGRGVAAQAVRQLAAWAFAHTLLNRLEILCAVGNGRSQRVAEKVGAVREGILRSRLVIGDEAHDAVIFSIVRGDTGYIAVPKSRSLRAKTKP